ncbi:hypothetical protein WI89_23535 [Burkholderia ubonensis]|uniref:hypothetical protein n=1 Tax=Burkholderia ubonensis TaxID=101571 RepID=UPI0007590290|nr:hypothetical protein [Burkholderia ubonensis]KVD81486.1 hypothetical protein WI89_23535 [Burkholderia ubonensis]
MSSTLTTRTRAPVVNDSIPNESLDDGNPLLANVLPVPKLSEAMRLTETHEPVDTTGWSAEEIIAHQASHTFVTNTTFGRALMAVICQTRSSYRARDLRTEEYRDHAISANLLLHHTAARHRREVPSRFGIAPHAQRRGILLAAPVRAGRRSFASIVESVIGRGVNVVRVPVDTGFTEYLQLRSLRIHWPIDGKLPALGQAYLGAIDTALNTDYTARTRSPVFRERDILSWMCALGVVTNLGLLIVERINYHDAHTKAAESSWNALGELTRTTGIPVLCLATAGATATGLATLPGAASDLMAGGLFEVALCRSPRDRYWIDICQTIFDNTLGRVGIHTMPSWLPNAAYDLTLGYPGALASALTSIALHLSALKLTTITEDIFMQYGRKALELDMPHLDAVRLIRQGGSYRASSLLRHADWLSFAELATTHPMPELR